MQGSTSAVRTPTDRLRGTDVSRWVDGQYVYWSRRIDALRITQRRLERRVQQIIDAFLLLIAVAGVAAGGWELYRLVRAGFDFDPFLLLRRFANGISEWRLFFWIGLACALTFFYRSTRVLEREVAIRFRKGFLDEMLPDPGRHPEGQQLLQEGRDISPYFSGEAYRTIEFAWQLAASVRQIEVRPEHLFVAMLTSNTIVEMTTRLGIPFQDLVRQLREIISRQPPISNGQTVLTGDVRRILLVAYEEAYRARRDQVGVPELFVGLTMVESASQTVLFDREVDTRKARNVVAWMNMRTDLRHRLTRYGRRARRKPKNTMNRSMTARPTPLLDSVSHDLTLAARAGALPTLIDRTEELRQCMRILKRDEGHVLIIGDAGVGKTTIGDGIAQLMVAEDVPPVLQDKRLVSISPGALVAGAGQGQVEERMLTVIDEVVKAGNVVLFIDDIANLVGTGMGSGENVDAAQILANAMSRGLVKVIAGSTTQDFQTYLVNDDAFMRRFQIVKIKEMDTDTAIQVLEAKANSLEYQHRVFFSYDAIDQSVMLSDRYIHDRYLPAKAVAILEEAAVYASEKRGENAVVSGEDVAELISQKTDIKVTKVGDEEGEKLLNLEERIHERVIGQNEAVSMVANAIRRARAELRDEHRPIVNMLFLGPTGVGKTELAKAIAEVYFGSEELMIRLDMSEYQEQKSLSRLIGAPPGYSGSSSGGYLTEAVRQKPYTLVLLDELEKAHPEVLNVFLQVMDDARLTDGAGRTIDFSNVILIATSNAGSHRIQEGIQRQESIETIKQALLDQELKPYFRPEFLNRFDGVVVFKPLTQDEVLQIAYLMLTKLEKRLAKKGITLKATDEAVEELAKAGFNPEFGARPLRRVMQEQVDNALAKFLLTGKLGRRDIAILEAGGKVSVERAPAI